MSGEQEDIATYGVTPRGAPLLTVVLLFAACGGTTPEAAEPASAANGGTPRTTAPPVPKSGPVSASWGRSLDPTYRFEDPRLAELMQQETVELLDAEVDAQGRVSEFAHLIELIEYAEKHPLSERDQEQLGGWLYKNMERIGYVFGGRMRRNASLPKDCVFVQAAARLSIWMTKNLERYKKDVQKTILVKLHGRVVLAPGRAYRIADALAPRFDLFAYDLDQFDAWQEAGCPVDSATSVAVDVVVCPRKPFKSRGQDTFLKAEHCSAVFYEYALENEINRRRFARYLIEKGDERIVTAAFLNIALDDGDAAIDLLAFLEEAPKSWGAAWRVTCRYGEIRQRHTELVKHAVRMWHKHPPLRGKVLFGLALFSKRFYGALNWRTVKETWGIDISQEDFKHYLAESPMSFSLSYVLWDAFAAGWSRADALIPHLDGWLKDPPATEHAPQNPDRALRNIIDAMCRERNRDDLKKLRAYLEARVAARPDDPYAILIRHTQNKTCAPRPRPEPSIGVGEEVDTLRIIQTED